MLDEYSKLLVTRPWVPYTTQFMRDTVVLEYPESVIFAAQLLSERLHELKNDIYSKYPYAEQPDLTWFKTETWEKARFVFNTNFRMIEAPEAIKNLENLYRRLRFDRAKRIVTGVLPFQISLNIYAIFLIGLFVEMFVFVYNFYASTRPSD